LGAETILHSVSDEDGSSERGIAKSRCYPYNELNLDVSTVLRVRRC
jgi:hypothetical protein